jgi:hypothetical protein
MEPTNLNAKIACAFVLATGISGCAGNQSLVPAGHNSVASWVKPAAKADELLYVSDYNLNEVFVLSYSTGQLVGTLSGFNQPGGLCTDRSGDVFVTDGDRIVEYAHGASQPTTTFTYSGGAATSCSVDPKTGNLAVTNFEKPNIAVFRSGSQTPTVVPISFYAANAVSYDDKGNLFVYEIDRIKGGALEVLHPKQSMVKTIEDGDTGCIGSLEYYAGHLLMGIPDVYTINVSHDQATIVGTTQLAGTPKRDLGGDQLIAQNKNLIAAFGTDFKHPTAYKVGIWRYPSGRFVKSFGNFGAVALSGIALSAAP